MTSHFIITSAIYTSYGKCSTEERIAQTRETIKSIETYSPGSSMVIIDCGEKSVEENMFDCELVDYTKKEEIQYHLGEYLKKDIDLEPDIIIKSMLEIMMFSDYLKNITNSLWIESEHDKKDYSPVTLEYGEMLEFDGANLYHGTEVNKTNQTRVSLDFRILPKKVLNDNINKLSKKAIITLKNYYDEITFIYN